MIMRLLNQIKIEIELKVPIAEKYILSIGTNNGFEVLVPEILEQIKNDGDIRFEYNVHLGHHFPDIDIIINQIKYGLELKSRNNASWSTNGNSVFESITGSEYEEIYLLFGSYNKNEQQLKIKYAPYWRVATNIMVTHSPRFHIDMNASANDSVFENSENYQILRNSTDNEKMIFIQNYLREKTNGSKWYITQQERNQEVIPIRLSQIERKQRNRIIVETLIIYPQDFFKSSGMNQKINSNYYRATEYVISTYYYFSPSFRDLYSAGGVWTYRGNEYPRIFQLLNQNREIFEEIFTEANPDFIEKCFSSWQEVNIDLSNQNFKHSYSSILDFLGTEYFSKIIRTLPNQRLSSLLQG